MSRDWLINFSNFNSVDEDSNEDIRSSSSEKSEQDSVHGQAMQDEPEPVE